MDNKAYWEARGYSFKLNHQDYIDLVHDAFLMWYNKTQQNLFEEHRGVITKVIKNLHWNKYLRNTYMYQKVVYNKQFQSMNRDPVEFSDVYEPESSITPESVFIDKEYEQQISATLSSLENRLLQYVKDGYTQKEVSDIENMSTQMVNYYIKQAKTKTLKIIK